MLPRISVVVPVYHVEKYVSQCLQSIGLQSYQGEIECVIVDDCGRDNSVSVVREFINNYSGKVEFKLIHHERNRGVGAARNTGVANATGEYILFLDSDDFIHERTLEVLYQPFAENQEVCMTAVLLYTYPKADVVKRSQSQIDKFVHEDGKNKIISSADFFLNVLQQKICFTACGKLMPKALIADVPFFVGRNNEDTRFLFDFSQKIEQMNKLVIELPHLYYAYRYNDSGICSNLYPLKMDYLRNLMDIRRLTGNEAVKNYAQEESYKIEKECFGIVVGRDYRWMLRDYWKMSFAMRRRKIISFSRLIKQLKKIILLAYKYL